MTSADAAPPGGRLRGQLHAGVARWLGVPYAQPPLGALRLRAPRPLPAWSDLREALQVPPASLQTLAGPQAWLNAPIAQQSEDCLYLNIWAPPDRAAGPAPVLLWFHGGATRSGHGASPASEGTRLAQQGLVVVTVNYRLGALGGLAHPLLTDELSGQCANWGLQDKLAALAWVHRSIAAFGGDPARITIAGQSSGATHVALIAQHRLDQGRAARAIVQSPPLFRAPLFATLAEAAEYTELLARSLGVTVPALREIDGARLQQAEHTLAQSPELLARMARPRTSPVLDGRLLHAWPHDAPTASIPLLAGWTATESDFWFQLDDGAGRTLSPQQAPRSVAEFRARGAKLVALHHAFDGLAPDPAWPERYLAGTRDAAQAWQALYTDLAFRAPIAHWLARHARAGTPAWGYAFAQAIASAAGGTPHAADVPFVFGTCAHPHLAPKVGDPAAAARTSDAMRAAWCAFVRDGDPGSSAGLPWPRFDAASPRVMRFGGEPVVGLQALARSDGLACWPGYRRDRF